MAKEIGYTGLAEWSGIIQEDFLRELQGAEGYKRFNEMRLNSPVVGAMLLSIEHAIRGVDWHFESDQGENDPRLELLDAAMENMTTGWNDHISEALTMLPFGWSYFEIVYDRIGAQVLWRKFAMRGQDTLMRWQFDDTGGLAGMMQAAPPKYIPVLLPIEKCLLYRTRVEKNNPEGRSMLRNSWIPYYFWKHISQVEGIGVERDLAGLPKITMPEGATTGENDPTSDEYKARKIVRNVRNDQQAGVVLPFGWEFELVSTGGSRQFDTDAIIRRYESRILMSALAQFLVLGQDKVGTQALSTDQTDFFTMSVNATADIIAETFSKYAVPRLLTLNGLDPNGVKLEHSPAGDTNLTTLADFLQKTGAMITWTTQDEIWLRSVAKLPEMDAAELQAEKDAKQQRAMEIAQRTAQPSAPPQGNAQAGPPSSVQPEQQGATVYNAVDLRGIRKELQDLKERLA